MQATIQPITIYPHQVNVLRIDSVKVRSLGSNGNALILCTYISESDQQVQSQVVEMPTEVYNTWGSDDTIVLDYALNALGLTRA